MLEVEITDLDPDFPAGLAPIQDGPTLSLEAAATAVEVLLCYVRPDYDDADRISLARLWLDLALEPLGDNIGLPMFDVMRERMMLPVRPYVHPRPKK